MNKKIHFSHLFLLIFFESIFFACKLINNDEIENSQNFFLKPVLVTKSNTITINYKEGMSYARLFRKHEGQPDQLIAHIYLDEKYKGTETGFLVEDFYAILDAQYYVEYFFGAKKYKTDFTEAKITNAKKSPTLEIDESLIDLDGLNNLIIKQKISIPYEFEQLYVIARKITPVGSESRAYLFYDPQYEQDLTDKKSPTETEQDQTSESQEIETGDDEKPETREIPTNLSSFTRNLSDIFPDSFEGCTIQIEKIVAGVVKKQNPEGENPYTVYYWSNSQDFSKKVTITKNSANDGFDF